jgi:hypothetical protein
MHLVTAAVRLCLLFGLTAQAGPVLDLPRNDSGTLTLTWVGSGILEQSDQLAGPWKEVTGAMSGWQTDAATRQKFYRLRSAYLLQVDLSGSGTGIARFEGSGLECRDSCQQLVDEGAEIRLVALADPGSVFDGWTGDFVGTGDCTLFMDGPKHVTGAFSADTPASGFVNGDFEQGPKVGWQQEPSNMIYTAQELGVMPYGGNYAAWVGYHPDNRKWAAIRQVVTLPDSWPLYLNFALWLYSEELCDPPWWDTFGVHVNDETIEENSRLCSGNTGGDGWRRISLNVSAYAGQTVAIVFQISSVDTLASVALIDEVFIGSVPW